MVPLGAIWFILAAYAVRYRYLHVATKTEQQQIKWVMGGILGWGTQFIVMALLGSFFPVTQPSIGRILFLFWFQAPVYALSLVLLPLTMMVAVTRYRLWAIDIIIRRTLQYSLLSLLLALVYFSSVILLQTVAGGMLSERSPVSIVFSTLLIAALFTPLRSRVQQIIDKRFYRQKYDAQKVLAAFATVARDETDLGALTAELTRVAQETMQPKKISIWLRDRDGRPDR